MVCYIRLSAVSANLRVSHPVPAIKVLFLVWMILPLVLLMNLLIFGKSWNPDQLKDLMLATKILSDTANTQVTVSSSTLKFSVNANTLDEYFDYTSAMLQKFTVAPNKVLGYNRLVGQENPLYRLLWTNPTGSIWTHKETLDQVLLLDPCSVLT